MIIGFRAQGCSISESAEIVNCSRAAAVKIYHACQNFTIKISEEFTNLHKVVYKP